MTTPENSGPSPSQHDVQQFRYRSLALAYLSMVASAGYVILIHAIQDLWGDPHAALTGSKYLPFILSNVAAFIGAAMIILKVKAGLWIYLAGQALFFYVTYIEIMGGAKNRWDDFLQLFTLLGTAVSLTICILQSIFTFRSEI